MVKLFRVLSLAAVASLSLAPALVSAAETAAAPQAISVGKMVFAANNQRLGAVYRVSGDSVQVIVDGKMVNVPASTISAADKGRYVTTLSRDDILHAH
jgi:hypothetical protein